MTTNDNQPKICPYPGLRPFTEEESIFFKGRDTHIQQIITQLEEKKFVMLTGASGDGKSSVVYAGVVPNVRAGFFKAKFNKWVFVDFKPGRSPLKNMVGSLANHLGIENEKVENRLKSGFSSLIEVYKSSQYYLDTESESYVSLDEKGKKEVKRKAANLFILVDQFEEFFTNTENFSQGKPSLDAQLVVNILLETARISTEKKLPIYIVFTMRSDFIGQCAAFRGLPEYIGFSQFFVPRLKRKEIYEVIEEPVKLSDNRISRRLLETLIDELHEGFDQLPVLQHALNQIWKQADNGEKEMDLIHLAKLSGLPSGYLPEKDQNAFSEWYKSVLENNAEIKEVIEKDFGNPSLENVLNTHANELYNSAAKYYEKNHPEEEEISTGDSKQIIKTAFQCLTKIDASRAVRIRMTLQEITDIINLPEITTEKVGGILNIFREQGNTFVSPFILSEKPETIDLKSDTVLDITHESLIRNWELLRKWAREENENWQNFLDFNKQLQRWINSEKSSGYLLPIGPLTFFENWFNRCKPNKYWLVKYDDSDSPIQEKLQYADETVNLAREFIKRSARRLFVSRTILKYGAQRIAAVFGLVFLVSAITYYTIDFRIKQNDYVINDIIKKGKVLLKSDKVTNIVKAHFLINHERLYSGSTETLLNSLQNDTLAFDIAYEEFSLIQEYDNDNVRELSNPLADRMLVYMDSVLTTSVTKTKNSLDKSVNRVNDFLKICFFINYNCKKGISDKVIKTHMQYIERYIDSCINKPESIKAEQFNTSIELLLTLSDYDKEKVNSLLQKISPFGESGVSNFNKIYPKDEKIQVYFEYYLSHKGGYQILSYLYSSMGDYAKLNSCLDSLIKYNKDYKNIYNENFYDIFYYLFKYQDFSSTQASAIIKKYLVYAGSSESKFYEALISRLGPKLNFYNIYYKQFSSYFYYLSLISNQSFGEKTNKLWDVYLNSVAENISEINGKNLNIALYYKRRGIYTFNCTKDSVESARYFSEAIKLYNKIPSDFLKNNFVFYNQSGEENKTADQVKNSVAFLYPLSIGTYGYTPLFFYSSIGQYPFFEYLLKNNLEYLYKTEEDHKSLETFIYQYYNFLENYKNQGYIVNYRYLDNVVNIVKKSADPDKILNKNFVTLVRINKAFEENDTAKAFGLYKNLEFEEIKMVDFQKQELPRGDVNIKLLSDLAKNLALNYHKSESFEFLKTLKNPWDKRNCIIDISFSLQTRGPVENTFFYLDSIFKEVEKKPKFGMKLFHVLGMIGSQPLYDATMNLFKDIDDKLKPRALKNFVGGISYNGLYYKAGAYIPEYTSRVNQLDLYNEILHSEVILNRKQKLTYWELKLWEIFDKSYYGESIPENYEFEQEHFFRFID